MGLAAKISKDIKNLNPDGKLADFSELLYSKTWPDIENLKNEVEALASQFPTIGF